MAKQKKQDNRTVSFGTNDKDLVKHIDKLDTPFSTYVKELIKQDINKSALDTEFKENLKIEIIDVFKEALEEASETKKLKQIKAILGTVGEENFKDTFRSFNEVSEKKEASATLDEHITPDFKIVETKNKIKAVSQVSDMKEEAIEEDNTVDKKLKDDVNALLDANGF